MNKLDRLIIKAGGVLIGDGRHRYYELDGKRLTVHKGTRLNSQQVKCVLVLLKRRGK